MYRIRHDRRWVTLWNTALITTLLSAPPVLADSSYQQARHSVATTNGVLKQTQERINQLDHSIQTLEEEYRAVLAEMDSYQIHNQQLQAIVDSQNTELNTVHQQLLEIDQTTHDVMPMMARMIESLDMFIAQDVPFLPKERTHRLERLKHMMRQADVSLSEKYRKILEAYQVEMDYGTTLEAYDGEQNGLQLEFIRVGRVALYSRTPDGSHVSVWNHGHKRWQPVSGGALQYAVQQAARMARKQQSPDLFMVLAPAGEQL